MSLGTSSRVADREQVILVNASDRVVGSADKLVAHQRGLLHHAISVFIFRSDGTLLLQQRSQEKYHSAGLWANACCGHPRPGEQSSAAALRRLLEELGLSTRLRATGRIRYKAEVPEGFVENEISYVFFGTEVGNPMPNPQEVQSWEWVPLGEAWEGDGIKKLAPWFAIYGINTDLKRRIELFSTAHYPRSAT